LYLRPHLDGLGLQSFLARRESNGLLGNDALQVTWSSSKQSKQSSS
jgi:hypothetical protein